MRTAGRKMMKNQLLSTRGSTTSIALISVSTTTSTSTTTDLNDFFSFFSEISIALVSLLTPSGVGLSRFDRNDQVHYRCRRPMKSEKMKVRARASVDHTVVKFQAGLSRAVNPGNDRTTQEREEKNKGEYGGNTPLFFVVLLCNGLAQRLHFWSYTWKASWHIGVGTKEDETRRRASEIVIAWVLGPRRLIRNTSRRGRVGSNRVYGWMILRFDGVGDVGYLSLLLNVSQQLSTMRRLLCASCCFV